MAPPTARLLAGILLALAARTAPAQRPAATGHTGFFSAGMSWIATGDLNARMAAGGYPTFDTPPFTINAAAYRLLRSRLLIGGEWHYLSLGESAREGRVVGAGGGYATLGIGYAMDVTSRLRVYPRLGLGVAGMGLWTVEPDTVANEPVAFDGWLSQPRYAPSQSTLSQASMAVDAGAGAEVALRASGRGPVVGVRVGYLATPFDQGWTLEGRPVAGAPDVTVAGPYARLLIGWRRER